MPSSPTRRRSTPWPRRPPPPPAATVGDADMVSPSTAVPADNPELVEAAGRGIPVVRRGPLLGAIAAGRRTIAIAGTHGKTSTTAMLATTLAGAGVRPSFVVGG